MFKEERKNRDFTYVGINSINGAVYHPTTFSQRASCATNAFNHGADGSISSSHSHSFSIMDGDGRSLKSVKITCRCFLAACCFAVLIIFHSAHRQHHSFTSKPPCQPTPLRSPTACYTTAAFQQRSPASIATAALQQAPSLTDASDDR